MPQNPEETTEQLVDDVGPTRTEEEQEYITMMAIIQLSCSELDLPLLIEYQQNKKNDLETDSAYLEALNDYVASRKKEEKQNS